MARPAFFLSIALLVGCSSSSSSNDGAADSASDVAVGDAHDSNVTFETTPSDDTATTDDADGNADAGCVSLTNIALEVTEQDVPSTMPAGGGGLVADGIYTITAVTKYTGPGGKSGAGTYRVTETIRITGGTAIDGVRKVGDTPGYTYTAKMAPHADGTLQWKQTCPDALGVTYQFDASSDALVLYDTTQKIATTYTVKIHTPGP